MRIVGGEWRGRPIKAPRGRGTRPTSDRVREALFDALTARLGADLGGSRVLDLYAGTGGLGLEALSRGAESAVFVESGREALGVLEANIADLGATPRAKVIAAAVSSAVLARAAALGPFALLLLDPPYRIEPALVASALEALDHEGALEPGALVAWEHSGGEPPEPPAGFEKLRTYTYGSTALTLLEKEG